MIVPRRIVSQDLECSYFQLLERFSKCMNIISVEDSGKKIGFELVLIGMENGKKVDHLEVRLAFLSCLLLRSSLNGIWIFPHAVSRP